MRVRVRVIGIIFLMSLCSVISLEMLKSLGSTVAVNTWCPGCLAFVWFTIIHRIHTLSLELHDKLILPLGSCPHFGGIAASEIKRTFPYFINVVFLTALLFCSVLAAAPLHIKSKFSPTSTSVNFIRSSFEHFLVHERMEKSEWKWATDDHIRLFWPMQKNGNIVYYTQTTFLPKATF